MWAREKPQDPEPERLDGVTAIAFEKGSIFAWTPHGKKVASRISYDPDASAPYLIEYSEWEDFTTLSPGFPFDSAFMLLVRRKRYYSLGHKYELVLRDPDQLREYSLVGIR